MRSDACLRLANKHFRARKPPNILTSSTQGCTHSSHHEHCKIFPNGRGNESGGPAHVTGGRARTPVTGWEKYAWGGRRPCCRRRGKRERGAPPRAGSRRTPLDVAGGCEGECPRAARPPAPGGSAPRRAVRGRGRGGAAPGAGGLRAPLSAGRAAPTGRSTSA